MLLPVVVEGSGIQMGKSDKFGAMHPFGIHFSVVAAFPAPERGLKIEKHISDFSSKWDSVFSVNFSELLKNLLLGKRCSRVAKRRRFICERGVRERGVNI